MVALQFFVLTHHPDFSMVFFTKEGIEHKNFVINSCKSM